MDLNGEISGELKQCADVIAQTDNKMLEIRKRIEAQGVELYQGINTHKDRVCVMQNPVFYTGHGREISEKP